MAKVGVAVTGDAKRRDEFLRAHGLVKPGEVAEWMPLEGGVSSEIWRVDVGRRSICVKRALPTLKVRDVWEAPVSRNAFEWNWLVFASRHEPAAVPRPLAHDASAGLFAMEFLPPDRYPVWKAKLLAGDVDPAFAVSVGALLGRLHQASAGREELRREFDSLSNFHALRLEPYLLATANRHPDLAAWLRELSDRTARNAIALVHGDVSPKNILVGPEGPVVLDAECAWFGDPAFDIAFCTNHLLLKALVRPESATALHRAFDGFVEAYFHEARFEPRAALEERAAHLLPGLFLARIDGKSPVEYLVGREKLQASARTASKAWLLDRPSTLEIIGDDWYAR